MSASQALRKLNSSTGAAHLFQEIGSQSRTKAREKFDKKAKKLQIHLHQQQKKHRNNLQETNQIIVKYKSSEKMQK